MTHIRFLKSNKTYVILLVLDVQIIIITVGGIDCEGWDRWVFFLGSLGRASKCLCHAKVKLLWSAEQTNCLNYLTSKVKT